MWVYKVILGAMIPSILIDVRAERVAIPGLRGFISDHWGFFFFVPSSILAVAFIQSTLDDIMHSWLASSNTLLSLAFSNLIFLFVEFVAFKIPILGRKG